MRPPSINLARRPFRNNTVYFTVFGVCLVMLLTATVYNINNFVARGHELDILRQRLADRSHRYRQIHQDVESMKKEIARVNLSVLSEKSAFANGLIVSHLFSWSELFDHLEELIPLDVKIRSIRPSISSQAIEITIDGMAKSASDLYEFQANLDGSRYFSNVYPLSENTRESRNEINFDLAMSYLPNPEIPEPAEEAVTTAGAGAPAGDRQDAAVEPAGSEEPAEGGAPGSGPREEPEPVATGGPAATAGGNAGNDVGDAAPPVHTGPVTQRAQATQTPPAPVPANPPAARPARPPAAAAGGAANPVGGMAKGPQQMTNKEFIEALGEDRFMRLRGPLVPVAPDQHGEATNAGLIRSIGLEAFLAARGHLTVEQQRRAEAAP